MAGKIRENIKVEGYVDQMEPDFTTTTGINKIVSQIMLMNSVQEYFAFSMVLGCGIPYVDMKGTREDWVKLGDKIKNGRKLERQCWTIQTAQGSDMRNTD